MKVSTCTVPGITSLPRLVAKICEFEKRHIFAKMCKVVPLLKSGHIYNRGASISLSPALLTKYDRGTGTCCQQVTEMRIPGMPGY